MSIFFLLLIFSCLSFSGSLEAQNPPTPSYEEAVPQFIDDVTDAVKGVSNLQEIGVWADQTRNRLPELLDDLAMAVQELSDQGLGEFDIEPFAVLAEKWNTIVNAYPGIENIAPLVAPILEQLLSELPKINSPVHQPQPLQNLFELYKQMEQKNPFGFGPLFHLEPLPDQTRIKLLEELSEETIKSGIKEIFIFRREKSVSINGVQVFYELIQNGEIIERFVEPKEVTLIHEALKEMKKNNEDPEAIAVIEELVKIIDENLKMSMLIASSRFRSSQLAGLIHAPSAIPYFVSKMNSSGIHDQPKMEQVMIQREMLFKKQSVPSATPTVNSVTRKTGYKKAVNNGISNQEMWEDYSVGIENAFVLILTLGLFPIFLWVVKEVLVLALPSFRAPRFQTRGKCYSIGEEVFLVIDQPDGPQRLYLRDLRLRKSEQTVSLEEHMGSASQECPAKNRSASRAAMQPEPAAVTA